MTIIPDFGDDDESDRKFVIICSKGNLDMAYPALVLANAALGEGIETHLFFTFWGFDMITKSRMHDLQFSPVGNTAMHLPGRDTKMPQSLCAAARYDGDGDQDDEAADRRPGHSGGTRLPRPDRGRRRSPVACRMSADMNNLTEADLRDDVDGIINASDFIEMTDGAQLLFI